eukprot:5653330-Pyramimonas_sp.AAC.1
MQRMRRGRNRGSMGRRAKDGFEDGGLRRSIEDRFTLSFAAYPTQGPTEARTPSAIQNRRPWQLK